MKTISLALSAHLEGETTTLATLIKITRVGGVVLGLTSFDGDLTVDGVLYHAEAGFSGDALVNKASLKSKASVMTSVLDSAYIEADDLKAGLYDHARIDVFICNWASPSDGVIQIRRGWLGEVSFSACGFSAELRGLHDLLQRRVGETYTPECRHAFCDLSCGLLASSYAYTGSITSVTSQSVFVDEVCAQADNLFSYGLLTWTSGANSGLSMEVKAWALSTRTFTLWLPMAETLLVGDSYSVLRGCDKKFSTCRDTFSNATNFGGFPHLPGLAKILQYPQSS